MNKQYYIGVRFDEKDGHPIICNGGNIFNSYDACRQDTVDNAIVMALLPIPNYSNELYYSNELSAVENITKALQEAIETERKSMERFVKHKDYDTANICQQRIIAYEKAIIIAKTCF